MAVTVANLIPPDEYLERRQHVFPSRESLNWFVRQHRDQLMRCGALAAPTGRRLIDPGKFDRYVGRQTSGRAAKRSGSGAE